MVLEVMQAALPVRNDHALKIGFIMKSWQIFTFLFFVTFGSLYWLLTRPTEMTIPLTSSVTEPVHDAFVQQPIVTKQEMVKEMARYLEHTSQGHAQKNQAQAVSSPAVTKSTEHASEVFGFSLDQEFRNKLSAVNGFETFQQNIGNGVGPAIQEAEEAFKRKVYQNKTEQLALLELTGALGRVSSTPTVLDRLSAEAKTYTEPGEHQDLDYAGRAMQYYLNDERDESKKLEMIKSLGIEVVVLQFPITP